MKRSLNIPAVVALVFIAGLTSAALAVTFQAFANDDNNPATDGVPRAFSYQGHLDWDGEPVVGQVEMTFKLFGSADAPEDTPKWSETQTVNVYLGRFAVELGADPANPVTDAVYDASDLHLGITVQRLDDNGEPLGESVTLGGRQRINPAPYALWSTQSTNLNVANDLQVGGTLRPAAGTTGIRFPDNPFGGGGDTAWLTYFSESGENARLQIGVANDADDDIDFVQAGASRMRIENGNVTVLNNLIVNGTLAGRVVGGGTFNCTSNSATLYRCGSLWGAGRCGVGGGGACFSGPACTRGSAQIVNGEANLCYTDATGNFGAACRTWLCIE